MLCCFDPETHSKVGRSKLADAGTEGDERVVSPCDGDSSRADDAWYATGIGEGAIDPPNEVLGVATYLIECPMVYYAISTARGM